MAALGRGPRLETVLVEWCWDEPVEMLVVLPLPLPPPPPPPAVMLLDDVVERRGIFDFSFFLSSLFNGYLVGSNFTVHYCEL